MRLVSQIIDDALQAMNSGGRHWVKTAYCMKSATGENCYCIIGALRKAAGGVPSPQVNLVSRPTDYGLRLSLAQAELCVLKVVQDLFPDRKMQVAEDEEAGYVHVFGSIPDFNDHQDTTWPEVVAVMTKARERARLQEAKESAL